MKRTVRSLLPILAALITLPLHAQPNIEIGGGNKFDLGDIYRGAVVNRKVTVKNTGSGTLILDKLEASCGCTGAVTSNDHIAAGDSGSILITFNSKNFTGDIHKTVTVNSNAAENPRLVIEFTAKVIDEILMTPQEIWFRDAEVGKTASLTIAVRNFGHEDLQLTGFRCQLPGFTMKLPTKPIKPGKEDKIIAEFVPAKASGFITDGVFITTSNPRRSEIFIPVYGNAKEFKFQ
jgi:hypothetical protein